MKRFSPLDLIRYAARLTMALAFFWGGTPGCAAEAIPFTADSQYHYAEQRYGSGAYAEAIAEFNRFIHFFSSDTRVPMARYLTGMAYFKADRFNDAANVFSAICGDKRMAGLQTEGCFMLSRSHARQGRIEQAMVDLHNLIALSPPLEIINRARYELGWLHVDKNQWDTARHTFNQIDPGYQALYRIDTLDAALSGHDRVPTKSPTTAGLLSVIPGGGQIYCGRYQDALAAFLLNAGLILSAWEAFDNDLYALGGVISFVEFGFYSGNIYGAISSAHKFNRDQFNDFRDTLYRHRQPTLSISAVASGISLCVNIDF